MKLTQDRNGRTIQGFGPQAVVAVTAASAWTPGDDYIAFRVGQDCSYYIDSNSSTSAQLPAGAITVISKYVTSFTFDTTMNIEVM